MSSHLAHRLCAAIIATSTLSSSAFAATELEYPELLVTPRASERIKMESEIEKKANWYAHLPIQTGATLALVSGITMAIDTANQRNSADPLYIVPIGAGAAWLALTVSLSALYKPYRFAHKKLSTMENKTKKDELTRERFAEEEIKAASRTGLQLSVFSTVSMLGVGGMTFITNKPTSAAAAMGIATMAVGIAPWIFPYRWMRVDRQQRQYKKRIYGSLAQATLLVEPGPRFSMAPGVQLQLNF